MSQAWFIDSRSPDPSARSRPQSPVRRQSHCLRSFTTSHTCDGSEVCHSLGSRKTTRRQLHWGSVVISTTSGQDGTRPNGRTFTDRSASASLDSDRWGRGCGSGSGDDDTCDSHRTYAPR